MKIKKGDTIVVTIGKDRGKRGKIEKIFPKINAVQVAGINVVKRHLKRRDEKNPGGIIDMVKPLAISKVALICPACGKPTRVRYHIAGRERTRICAKCKEKI